MKILQLSKYYPSTYGGVEIVAEFFSRAFIEQGHQVEVLTFGASNKRYKGTYGEDVYQAKEDIKIGSASFSVEYFLKLRKLIRDTRYDFVLVHLPNPFSHEVLKWFSKELNNNQTKILGIYHSDIINQIHLRDAYNLWFSRSLSMYDNFLCSSENLKQSSAILSKLPSGKVKIIPFCIDHHFEGKVNSGDKKYRGKFLAIGRMVPYKGFEFLINCFKDMPYELTIVGNGPLKTKLENKSPKNVFFVGEINEEKKFKLLTSHSALIVSSLNRSEAYGMTIVEAFSVGLPVIASDIDTGVSFLVQDGKTGYKFSIKDEVSFRERLHLFVNDPEKSQQMSKECVAFYDSHLTYAHFNSSLKKIINELC